MPLVTKGYSSARILLSCSPSPTLRLRGKDAYLHQDWLHAPTRREEEIVALVAQDLTNR
jgi:hypothetical protein